MKKASFLFCFIFISFFRLSAQQHLTVEISHPVYRVLENAEQRGLIGILPGAKPYSRSTIVRILEEIQEQKTRLTPYENMILQEYLDSFKDPQRGLKNGKISAEGKFGSFNIGITGESEGRVNLNNASNFQMTNGLTFAVEGDLFNFLSYRAALGGSFDRISPDFLYKSSVLDSGVTLLKEPGTYAPYQYSKEWEGFHLGLDGSNTDGVGEYKIGFLMDNDISAQFLDDALIMRFGSFRREWGKGDGSLNLSGTARPFQAVELHIRPVDWFNYSYLIGSLGDWFGEDNSTLGSFQKNYTIQSLEIMPFPWLYLNATGTVVWGKRFELGYISPLVISIIQQNVLADFDNVGMSVGAAGVIPYVGKIHASLFVDEIRNKPITNIRNILAFQAGWEFPIPKLPFTTFKFQYTKLEPFVYTHYDEEDYAFFSTGVDLSYTHDGENITYNLPPNSDEFLFRVESLPHPQVTAGLTYKLIRHGTNSSSGGLDGNGYPNDLYIFGDMHIPLNYEDWRDYPEKNFLKDGLYDWTNLASLDLTFRLKNFPMEIGFEYIFSYTFWDANDTGLATPDPIAQNIMVLSVRFFS